MLEVLDKAAKYDLLVQQGSTFSESFDFDDVPLEGLHFRGQIRRTHSDPQLLSVFATQVIGNVLHVELSPGQTDALPAGNLVYDIEAYTELDVFVMRVFEGRVRVTPQATRLQAFETPDGEIVYDQVCPPGPTGPQGPAGPQGDPASLDFTAAGAMRYGGTGGAATELASTADGRAMLTATLSEQKTLLLPAKISQAEAEAGTATTDRTFDALRARQSADAAITARAAEFDAAGVAAAARTAHEAAYKHDTAPYSAGSLGASVTLPIDAHLSIEASVPVSTTVTLPTGTAGQRSTVLLTSTAVAPVTVTLPALQWVSPFGSIWDGVLAPGQSVLISFWRSSALGWVIGPF